MGEIDASRKTSGTLNVLWITNIANPYRIPVWRSLAEQVNLKMALLARAEPNRAWDYSEDQIGLPTAYVDAPVYRAGELSMYWPNRKLHKLLIQDLDAMILGGWESPAYMYALWIAKKRRIRTISHSGSTDKSHKYSSGLVSKVRSWFYRQLDAHVTYGTEATKSLLTMQIESHRIITGFNSVDHMYFNDAVNLTRAKNVNHEFEGHAFLYVGQLLKRKNIDSIIEAFSSIRTDGDTLRIVGSGPEQQHLQDLIIELGLIDTIVMTGSKTGEDLIEEYAQANTLILVSTNEVWGLVVNEALASGLHVVVSENCGVSSEVKEMPGVYICEASNSQVARAMQHSANAWHGPLDPPKVLDFDISYSAGCFFTAIYG